jgi:hypothetical protein
MLKDFGETYTQEEIEENRRIWIEALESGAYSQTTSYLRKNDSFCCLGVACKVLGAVETLVPAGINYYQYDDNDALLPNRVIAALGMASADGRFYTDEGERLDLVGMNDHRGATFQDIADVIKSKPRGLFIERSQPVASAE